MDILLPQFSLLADEALDDKNFDPSRIEALMELFEQEAYTSWSANEAELQDSLHAAEASMREAEAYLDSLMEASMADFRRSHDDAERASNEELSGLLRAADSAKKLVHALGTASKKYMDAALVSATETMKSALASSKVYPS